MFDVEELSTHGGSLRVFVCHDASERAELPGVGVVREKERNARLDRGVGYDGFATRVEAVRRELIGFLDAACAKGCAVAAYGAAARGNTLLNFCGVGNERISFVADRSLVKQGRLLPGSRIPIHAPEDILAARPDYVLILPWNLRTEICDQLAAARSWGGQFITAIPTVRVG